MPAENVFLRFDGILYENMTFEPLTGWETGRIARRTPDGDGTFLLELFDSSGSVLVRVQPLVEFGAACFETTQTMRATRVLAYIPHHHSARRLVFRRDERLIYETPVAQEPPRVELEHAVPKGESVSLRWKASHSADIPLSFSIHCALNSGKRFVTLARDLADYEAELSLVKVPGGKGQIIVVASDGLRSSYAVSDAFEIEPKPPQVWIISPRDGAVFPPDQPLSLVGQAVDVQGRKLPEDELVWEVDGQAIQRGSRIAAAIGLKPGRHSASLSLVEGKTKNARSSVSFTIADYNEQQLRYRQLMGLDK